MSEAGSRPFMPSLQGQQFAPAEKAAAPVDTDKLAAAEMETFVGESNDVDPDATGEHKVEPPPKPKKIPDGARSVDEDNERETPALVDDEDADEDADEGDDEDQDDEGGDDEEAADKDKKPERRKPSVSERMRQLTRARGEAERLAAAKDSENAELRARLEALERGEKPKAKDGDKPAAEGKPDPSKFKYGEVDPDYLDAMIDWKTDQRLAKMEKDRAENERATEIKALTTELEGLRDSMAEKGVAEFGDDYMTLVIEGAINNKWPVSPVIADLTLRSDVGHKVAHHLASNPKEAREVYGKSPTAQAAYFGRLEAKFLTAKAAPAKQPSPPNAPTPPKHQARGGGGKFSVGADTEDFAAFEAKVRAENRG